MSFAHLKKKPTKKMQSDLTGNLKDKSVQIKQKPQEHSTAKLIESRYCYGCLDFSVDYPETSIAMHWCRRWHPDGTCSFKRIFPEYLVRDCKGRRRVEVLI